MICHWQRIGRLLSPSSAASRSTSTKFDSAVSVKLLVRMKPTRSGRTEGCMSCLRVGPQRRPGIVLEGSSTQTVHSNNYISHVASLHALNFVGHIVAEARNSKNITWDCARPYQ